MNHIIEITDFDDLRLDIYARMTENQLLNRANISEGMFIAESPKVVERALDAGYEPVSCLVEKKHIDGEAANVLRKMDETDIFTAEFDVLAKLTGYKLTRGMLCAMRRKPLTNPLDFIKKYNKIAVLEDVENPTNVGAIIRSAAALNVDAVILTSDSSNPLYRRAIRVSMGTVFQIPWTIIEKENWPDRGVEMFHQNGFKLVAMALEDRSVSIHDEEINRLDKICIVLGTEGEGLKSETLAQCDYTVKIPMTHQVDSLNVAAASAVTFWQLCGNKI